MEMIIDFPGRRTVGLTLAHSPCPPIIALGRTAPTPFAHFWHPVAPVPVFTSWVLPTTRHLSRRHPPGAKSEVNPMTGMVTKVNLDIQVPGPIPSPEKYKPAIIRAADQCAVKNISNTRRRLRCRPPHCPLLPSNPEPLAYYSLPKARLRGLIAFTTAQDWSNLTIHSGDIMSGLTHHHE
ncbi:MAG: hypothetical protein IPH82_13465 [Chloroflexi bacterium]|nr:hypothetical protein [Chloroflexota bacterium]